MIFNVVTKFQDESFAKITGVHLEDVYSKLMYLVATKKVFPRYSNFYLHSTRRFVTRVWWRPGDYVSPKVDIGLHIERVKDRYCDQVLELL